MKDFKRFISNILLVAALGALVAFGITFFLPKQWQVSGRIVVFPSGKPVSASQNLAEEVGNTAWIVNGDTFQERYFGETAVNFAGAETVKNSSMVLVKFRVPESDIQSAEDAIVKIPGQIDEYARDLYEGSPFKYKMASDPEISLRPVRPDVVANSTWGFMIGAALYLLFWITVEDFLFGKSAVEAAETAVGEKKFNFNFRPAKEEVIAEKTEPEAPETTGQKIDTPEKPFIRPAASASAPSNLPVAEPEAPSIADADENSEPSDEEVKDRLNKLMRGEL